jgi:hypothetical protein
VSLPADVHVFATASAAKLQRKVRWTRPAYAPVGVIGSAPTDRGAPATGWLATSPLMGRRGAYAPPFVVAVALSRDRPGTECTRPRRRPEHEPRMSPEM